MKKTLAALFLALSLCGPVRGAAEFDGVDDCFFVAANANLQINANPFTIVFRIKTSMTTPVTIFMGHDSNTFDGFAVGLNVLTGGKIGYLSSNPTIAWIEGNSITHTNGEWHHVAVAVTVGATTNANFYLDGVADGSPLSGLPGIWTGNYYVGAGKGGTPAGDTHFIGTLDELAVFSRALTAAEVGVLYSTTRRRMPLLLPQTLPRNLELYWPFTDIPAGASWSGATIRDLSHKGTDGVGLGGASLKMNGHTTLSGL